MALPRSTPRDLVMEGQAWAGSGAGSGALTARIALRCPVGSWTCLLGPSGVGKSTLLRCITGIGGAVRWDGTLDGASPGSVAFMAQDPLLLPWRSALGNVLVGAALRGEAEDTARARALLAEVGLADRAEAAPQTLSGGERQRVALARTLMEDRPVVLLDEPFSALDARTRAQMQDLAARLLRGRTVLMVTHDPAEAARLGEALWLLHSNGLTPLDPPPGPPPRAHDAPEVLAAQGALFRLLLEER